jgi:hypothetical protein
MLRGCSYTATGTRAQLQQLAAKLVSQALGSAAFEPDPDIQQWWYLNEEVCAVLQADAVIKLEEIVRYQFAYLRHRVRVLAATWMQSWLSCKQPAAEEVVLGVLTSCTPEYSLHAHLQCLRSSCA